MQAGIGLIICQVDNMCDKSFVLLLSKIYISFAVIVQLLDKPNKNEFYLKSRVPTSVWKAEIRAHKINNLSIPRTVASNEASNVVLTQENAGGGI